jgi:manganese transport protein
LIPALATTRRTLRRLARSFSGPGLVFILASLGPKVIVTNAVAGAGHGYSLLWTLLLLAVARYVVLEASGRYVVATGESVGEGLAHYGRWTAWLLLGEILLKRHLTNLSFILLMGALMNAVIPLWDARGVVLWSLLLWGVAFALMWWGRYKRVEKWFRLLGAVLASSLVLVVVLSRPDPALVLRGLTVPSTQGGGSWSGTMFVLMALVGAGAGSVNSLKYPAFLKEKRWSSRGHLRVNRQQALLSSIGLLIGAALVQVAFAASGQTTQNIRTASDLIAVIGRLLGEAGRLTIAVGLSAAAFSTFVGTNTGYSLISSDLVHNVLRGKGKHSGTQAPGALPEYKWALLLFTVPSLYVLFTNWQPIWLVLLAAAFEAVMLPVFVGLLLALTSDPSRMGKNVNAWPSRIVMALVMLAALYLTWQNALALGHGDL